MGLMQAWGRRLALCGLWLGALALPLANATEPLQPLPRQVEYDRAKALLGKRLFLEPRLSADGRVACVSCHVFTQGGAESAAVSTGVFERKGRMNSPTVFNAFFNFRQFWNGRAANLQEQAQGPLHNSVEMGMTEAGIEGFLNADAEYRRLFAAVYGDGPIDLERLTNAIAEFVKALVTPNARFDRFLRGEIELTPEEMRGYLLFKSAGCVTCHNGINVGGNSYQYLGAVHPLDHHGGDGDVYELTGRAFDKNRFKAPSLRNVMLTAPYLHDGRAGTLREVLEIMAYHNLGFRLDESQVKGLMAFLNSLTGEMPAILTQP